MMVVTTEAATMKFMALKYEPFSGSFVKFGKFDFVKVVKNYATNPVILVEILHKYKLDCRVDPSSGTASLVAGMASATTCENTVRESRIVTPSDSFSPESGGSVKPSTAMEAMRMQGTIRLKK